MILLALLLQAAQTSSVTPPAEPQGGDIVVLAPSKPSAQTPATMVVEPVAMFIAACDADGDAITTRAEMEAGVARSFGAIDAAHAGALRYLAFADWAQRYLGDRNALPSPFDADKDGDDRVTLDELQAQFSKLYSRFNRDGSEGISRPELVTFRTGPVDANGPTKPGLPKKPRKKDGDPAGERRAPR